MEGSTYCEVGAPQVNQWYSVCLPVQEMQETWVASLGGEDPLEREMATDPSILACKILWTGPGGLESVGLQSQTWLRD